jgi:hypothetical protein
MFGRVPSRSALMGEKDDRGDDEGDKQNPLDAGVLRAGR